MLAVSVVMGTYNTERYLREAVDSILSQTFADFEFIVVDDGSEDGSCRLLQSYDDPRLRVHSRPHEGFTQSLNLGLKLAAGRYVARMDGDDIAAPTRLERQVSYLEQHPRVGILGSACYRVDEAGRRLATWVPPESDEAIRRAMVRHNPFLHPTVMIRRSAIEVAGGYDERFTAAEDYDLWFRIARSYQLANLPDPLMSLRGHRSSITSTRQRRALQEGLEIRWRAIRSGSYPPASALHLLGPAIMWALPDGLRQGVRSWLRGGTLRRIG